MSEKSCTFYTLYTGLMCYGNPVDLIKQELEQNLIVRVATQRCLTRYHICPYSIVARVHGFVAE